jgi:sulfite exporter TauE/SafE
MKTLVRIALAPVEIFVGLVMIIFGVFLLVIARINELTMSQEEKDRRFQNKVAREIRLAMSKK